MADKYVQLKDKDGNNLYPAVTDFPVPVANGGTGANSIAGALQNFDADGLFLLKTFYPTETAQISSGNATVWKVFTLGTTPDGYTPIAIPQYYLGQAVGYACTLYNITVGTDGNGKTYINTAWHNTNAGAGKVGFSWVNVLYVKTSFLVVEV